MVGRTTWINTHELPLITDTVNSFWNLTVLKQLYVIEKQTFSKVMIKNHTRDTSHDVKWIGFPSDWLDVFEQLLNLSQPWGFHL